MASINKGAYREPLTAGLRALQETDLAVMVVEKKLKLALAGTIRGAVVIRKDLTGLFVKALKTEQAGDAAIDVVREHYVQGLLDGTIVPVENEPAIQADHHYAPGELFFRS